MKKTFLTASISLFTCGLFAQTNLCFNPASPYNAGNNPYSVTTADLNGDSMPDLAIANSGSNTVSVLLNTGTGTFNAAVNYYAGKVPYSVTNSDFDQDGDIDLAVVNNGSDSIAILSNTGSGSFSLPVYYKVGVSPISAISADFNNDSYADIAVSNFGSSVSVLINSGSGTFLPALNFTVGSSPYGICAADFDNDGNNDIAVSDVNQNLVFLLQNSGSNTFSVVTTLYVGQAPYSITSGDFDQNGEIDIATANAMSNDISVVFNLGGNNFSSVYTYGIGYGPIYGPSAIISSDFDNDGKTDLATANFYNNSVSVITNNGGGFVPSSNDFSVGKNPVALTSGDFNNDGKIDIAAANDSSNSASVLLQCVVNGACLNFDSLAGDYVKINYMELPTNITHEMWFKTTSQNTTLFSVTSGGISTSFDRDIYLFNGNIFADVFNGSYETIYTSSSNYADGNWHHVAHVIGNSVGGQQLYVDGILKASGMISSSSFNGSSKILLGYSDAITGFGYGPYFQGSIDEVRIWNKALCQIEIQNHMNGEFNGPQSNLMAYYKFNQGFAGWQNYSITSLADSSGAGNDGSLYNFALSGNTGNWITPGAITSGEYINNITAQSVVCSGDSIVLTYTGANASSYSWTGPNGFMSNIPNVLIKPALVSNSGNYTLSVTDVAGCSLSSSVSVLVAPLPLLNVYATSSTICSSTVDTLKVQGATYYSWDFNTGFAGGNIVAVTPTNSTTYSVIGTDVNGCVASGTTSITVFQPPTAGFNYFQATCQCNTVLFTDTTHAIIGDPIASWYWSFSGQNFHDNASTSSVSENLANGNDTICMLVTTQSGCVDSTCTVLTGLISGIAELSNRTKFSIYPNPVISNLQVIGINAKEELIIVDVFGNVVKTPFPDFKGGVAELDVSSLPCGVYFVRVGNSTQKFIKQ